ncbi:hypothetical protein KAI54_04105 [Candidatus Gracilibacteria bacterium]|nr:hypothetical protein [Candidatus Gracilibacteria bacterium]
MNPKIAGIIAVLPTTFLVAYIFSVANESVSITNKFLVGSGIGLIAWLVFLPTLYFLNLKIGFWSALAIGYFIFVVVAFSANFLHFKIDF